MSKSSWLFSYSSEFELTQIGLALLRNTVKPKLGRFRVSTCIWSTKPKNKGTAFRFARWSSRSRRVFPGPGFQTSGLLHTRTELARLSCVRFMVESRSR